MEVLIVFLAAVVVIVIAIMFFRSMFKKKTKKTIEKAINKASIDKFAAIGELKKALKLNSNNFQARDKLIPLLIETQSYLPAIKELFIQLESAKINRSINEVKCLINIAKCYEALENTADAEKYYKMARNIDTFNVEANLGLGMIEIRNKSYAKAYSFFNSILKTEPNNTEALKYISICCQNVNKTSEAFAYIRKYCKLKPEDLEMLMFYANLGIQLNYLDDAEEAFLILQKDNKYFNEATLYLAEIYKRKKKYDDAIKNYDIAIKLGFLKDNALLDAYYSMAECCATTNKNEDALEYFSRVYNVNPDYKSVKDKIELYKMMTKNNLFEQYLTGNQNDFIQITKMFIKYYLSKFTTLRGSQNFVEFKIVQDGTIEVKVEISNTSSLDVVIFTFIRSTGVTGDLTIRGLYNRIKEHKLNRAVCVTAGVFSDTAKQFVESRIIELVEKERLNDILNKLKVISDKKK